MYYLNQKINFTVLIITSKTSKVAGSFNLDLALFVEKNNFTESFKLEKCPDKNAIITISMSFKYIEDIKLEIMS